MADSPAAKKPVAKKPGTKKPGTKKPGTKKPGTKKPGTKKPVAKKTAPAKTAATKTAATKKRAPAKKTAAKKKAPAKKAAAATAAPRVRMIDPALLDLPPGPVPTDELPADRSAGDEARGDEAHGDDAQQAPRPGRATPPSARPTGVRRRWAVSASITDDLLNDLVFFGLGDGVSMEPVEQEINLPAMGEVRLRLALTVTGVRFDLRGDDGGRARVTVLGAGDVSVRGSDYEGDVIEGAAAGFPTPPAPLPVALTTLADPFFELRDDHTVSVGLDLRTAELVHLGIDTESVPPDGVDPDAWTGILQMTGMMFSMMGEHLFEGLGEAVGSVGIDLGADVGMILADLGVDHGPADTQVSSGVLSFGLPAHVEVDGRAQPVPVAGKRLGVGVARSGVDRLAATLFERAAGNLPLPFELEIDLGEQQVGSSLRGTRLISERFPDLRSAVRTEVGVRLVRGRLEIAVSSAWLELPPVFPKFLNSFNRRVGGLLSMAPLRFRLPATLQLPLVPGSDDTVGVRVDDLRVTTEGVGVVIALS